MCTKAMVQDMYGSAEVMQLRDIDKPEIGDHDVLGHARAAGVNPADLAVMSGLPFIASPEATRRTALMISAGGVSLTRNPLAPARSALITCSSAWKVVSTITCGGSSSRRNAAVAVIPSISAMRISMST